MKQGSALLAAGILLLGTVGLLTRAKETGQQVQSQAISRLPGSKKPCHRLRRPLR